MADNRLTQMMSQGSALAAVPFLRQTLIMLALAASVALGVAAVMWSQGPDYRVLYAGLTADRAAAVIEGLEANQIRYKLDEGTGALMVPEEQLHEARLKLASEGLMAQSGMGLEIMEQAQGFGVSEFMETKRYQHALETELARTIQSVHQVRRARVHLAMPKQSVFVRERRPPSASILLDTLPGATLDRQQVRAIINLVASSVPELKPEQVTVVDQQGNLLSKLDENNELEASARQFEYRQSVERAYEQRIADLLRDITASGNVRVQVSADVDFAVAQESRESFNPERQVVRSEQILRDGAANASAAGAQGVPGALSNQPPEQVATQPVAAAAEAGAAQAANEPQSITRNYEIERTLNYVSTPPGTVRRLSVAVVVDAKAPANAGAAAPAAVSPEEIERLTTLVRDAIGFNEARGDRVTVMAADFRAADALEEGEAPAFWSTPAFQNVLKQGLVGLALLALVLMVIRPAVKNLLAAPPTAVASNGLSPEPSSPTGVQALGYPSSPQLGHDGASSTPALAAPRVSPVMPGKELEDRLGFARNTVESDPRLVAKVVQNWVKADVVTPPAA